MKIKVIINNYGKFPQADDVYKIISVCDTMYKNKFKELLLTPIFNNSRQKSYYYDSARYLKLMEEKKDKLTELGKSIFNKDINNILIDLSKIILSNDILYLVYKDEIGNAKEILKNRYNLSISTVERRIATARKWVKWSKVNLKEVKLEFYEI